MAERVRARGRRWTWRQTNLALLAALVLAFVSGAAAQATGSSRGAWVAVAHGVAGFLVIALIPWKSRVVAGGLRRRRPDRWAAVALAGLTVGALVLGIVSATGLLRSVAGQEPLWVHIALALMVVPLLAWHVVARPVRPRAADLGRRAVVRAGLLGVAGAGAYVALDGAVRLAGLPGAQRRFTGSRAVDSIPVTSWLDDAVPVVDAAAWRLTVVDGDGSRDLSLDELAVTSTVRATLDCTSGWYATRDWTGVPVAQLVGRIEPGHRSIRVRSLTGYDRYLPLSDLPHLLLALGSDDGQLTPGHGFPARLVAPGRRGFWWVKWVSGIELSRRPWWAQSPFPLA